MRWLHKQIPSKQQAIQEVQKAAAPVLDKLSKVREEHRRIDAQIEREIRLIRDV